MYGHFDFHAVYYVMVLIDVFFGFDNFFFFSSRRRHTRSVSAFLLNRSSDLSGLTPSQLYVFMPPNLGGFFMVRSYYPSECHADYFDFERIEALKPAIEACGISTLSQSPMLGFHKQMDNRIKLLEIGRAVQQECRDRSRMPSSA